MKVALAENQAPKLMVGMFLIIYFVSVEVSYAKHIYSHLYMHFGIYSSTAWSKSFGKVAVLCYVQMRVYFLILY